MNAVLTSVAEAPAVSEAALIDEYVTRLTQLSPDGRLELIARLSQTLKSAGAPVRKSILDFAGAWATMPGTDEEILTSIREARTFSRPEISLD